MAAKEPGPQQVPPWWTDPTENVKQLVDAAMLRQDDLREMQARYIEREAALRAAHARELRQAESARIDANRSADTAASTRLAEGASTTAATLAAQVAATAEAARREVAAAAAAAVTSLEAALAPLRADVRELREAQARGAGSKEQVAETREVRADVRQGTNLSMNAVALLISVLVLVVGLYATFHH